MLAVVILRHLQCGRHPSTHYVHPPSRRGDAACRASSRNGTTEVLSGGSSLRAAAETVIAKPSWRASQLVTCASSRGASQYPTPGLAVAYP